MDIKSELRSIAESDMDLNDGGKAAKYVDAIIRERHPDVDPGDQELADATERESEKEIQIGEFYMNDTARRIILDRDEMAEASIVVASEESEYEFQYNTEGDVDALKTLYFVGNDEGYKTIEAMNTPGGCIVFTTVSNLEGTASSSVFVPNVKTGLNVETGFTVLVKI